MLALAKRIGDRFVEGYSFEFKGQAYEGAGEFKKAEENFKKALEIRKELDINEIMFLNYARLTLNAHLQGKTDQALMYIDEIEKVFEKGNVNNVRILQTAWFNVFQALENVDFERAISYLKKAAELLTTQSAKIKEPEIKQSFLENVEEHRLIMVAKERYL